MTMEQLSTNELPFEVNSEHGIVNLEDSAQNLLAQLQNAPHLSNKEFLSAEIHDPEDEEINLLKRALLLDEETSSAEGSVIPPLPPFINSLPALPESLSGTTNSNSIISSNRNGFSTKIVKENAPNNTSFLKTSVPNFHIQHNNPSNNNSMSMNISQNRSILNHNVHIHNKIHDHSTPNSNKVGLPKSVPFSYNNIPTGPPNHYANGNIMSVTQKMAEQCPAPIPFSQLPGLAFNPTALPKPQISTNGIVQNHSNTVFPNGARISRENISEPVVKSKSKTLDTPSTPIEQEDESLETFFEKDGKQFNVGDFLIVNSTPNDNDQIVIIQFLKFANKKFQMVSGMIYKFASQATKLKETFGPREVLRTSMPMRFNIADVVDRCFILPEGEFVKLSPDIVESRKVYLLRYRYHEKRNEIAKARNLNILLRFSIKELKPYFINKVDSQNSKRVTFSANLDQSKSIDSSKEKSRRPVSTNSISVNQEPPRMMIPLPVVPEFSLASTKCTGFLSKENSVFLPCNNKNNVKWFTTPPLHPPPPSLEVAHSLEYLVHLAKKRKASTSKS